MPKIGWKIISKPSLNVKWLLTPSVGGFLEHFGPELGSQNWVHFPKLGILNSFKFACIAKVAFEALFGALLDRFWIVFGGNSREFGSRILV